MILNITISGSGTPAQLAEALNSLIQTIECASWSDITGTYECEDEILIGEISKAKD